MLSLYMYICMMDGGGCGASPIATTLVAILTIRLQ